MKQRILLLLILIFLPKLNHAVEFSPVPHATDLQQLGEEASERNLPILIMFSMSDCPYCDFIRDDYLQPMMDDPVYSNKIIIRELYTDRSKTIQDFNGSKIKPMTLAQHYQATFAPTLVFVDSNGNELVEKMIGVTTPDFYGGYLDQAINQSYLRLNRVVLLKE